MREIENEREEKIEDENDRKKIEEEIEEINNEETEENVLITNPFNTKDINNGRN